MYYLTNGLMNDNQKVIQSKDGRMGRTKGRKEGRKEGREDGREGGRKEKEKRKIILKM